MSEDKSPKDMSMEELGAALTEKYGQDWHFKDLDPKDPLAIEFADRIGRGR